MASINSTTSSSADLDSNLSSSRNSYKESLALYRDTKQYGCKPIKTSSSVNKQVVSKKSNFRYVMRKIQKSHLKGTVLVLIWSFFVWSVMWHSFSEVFLSRTSTGESSKLAFKQATPYIVAHYSIIFLVFLVGTPLSGWLADAYVGRYKVLKWSLLLVFVGVIIRHSTDLIFIYGLEKTGDNLSVGAVFLLLVHCVGSVFLWSGAFGFLSNSVQFGVDQMPDASANEVSTFIFWYIFAQNLGIWCTKSLSIVIPSCLLDPGDSEVILEMLIPVVYIAFALCLNFLFKNVLVIEPQTSNPFKLIYGVLKYAATHNKPVIRSALTYRDEQPSRLDLGKHKFGGSFSVEQVENVKTFLRILFLMWPTVFVVIAYSLALAKIDLLPQSVPFNKCKHTIIETFVYDHSLLIVLGILFYEFVIYPVLRRNLMRILRRIVAAACIICCVSVLLGVVDLIEHAVDRRSICKGNISAFINISYSQSPPVAMYFVNTVMNMLMATAVALLSTATYEFVYAQTPYSMRGIMMGLIWFVFAFSLGIFGAILYVWNSSLLFCEISFYALCFFIALTGLILFGITAYCYKNRVRDDIRNETAIIEEVFARRIRCAIEYSENQAINT